MLARLERRSTLRLGLAFGLAALLVLGRLVVPDQDAAALSKWTGGVQLYRSDAFTTQKSWLWCTAADVQIMRNIDRRATDHSSRSQRAYFTYMRSHNRYDIPASDGVDPVGWTAGLRHYVDDRYRLVQSKSFDSALRSAVTNLRKTNLPVAITVSHGNHAWIIVGFTATADPAATTKFSVTSVRVVGSLWGLQSRTHGYDMKPNTKLTPKQLKGFFTPWHYAGVKMAWEGRWVSVQPIAVAAKAVPATKTKPSSTAPPNPSSIATSAPAASAEPAPTPSATTAPTVRATAPPAFAGFGSDTAVVAGPRSTEPASPASAVDPSARAAFDTTTWLLGAGVMALLAIGVCVAGWWIRARP